MNEEDLKPCPFCGGKDLEEHYADNWVKCKECGAESGIRGTDDWNDRPIEDSQAARIAELEAMLRKFKEYTTIAAHDREQIYKTLMSIDMDIDDYFNGK